ncbi:MAG: tetratricopeptide repeat protein [Thermodesulfobacterium sp.]|nr:tetratricopeptide repeat protein [Thermodesulfobacterium sp.]
MDSELERAYELSKKAHEFWIKGRTLDALAFYEEALETFKNYQRWEETANILEKIGDIYFFRKNYERALKAYKACLDICENFEDEISTSIIGEKIVFVYKELNTSEKALPYLYRILEIAEKYRDAHRAGRALVGIGDVYRALKNYQASKEAYELALKIYRGMGALELAKIVEEGLKKLQAEIESSLPEKNV